MSKRIAAIDQYILKSQEFAQPILIYLRELIHAVCPDVEEKIKWNFPHFDYKGEMMCHLAAFNHHCTFGFWKASLLKDKGKNLRMGDKANAMGQFGKITCEEDLPSEEILLDFILQAMELNEKGIKIKKKVVAKPTTLEIPDYFKEALNNDFMAAETFQKFTLSGQREYVNWVASAKTEKTRNERLKTSILWLSEGKKRDWKYSK